jgi:RNA polymerase sigma factor (sigma-70 family)
MEADHPEKKWLKAYKKGDLAALGLLVEHFRRPLFSFILNMMPRHGDAEEIFQETWLRAIRNLPRFREGNFAGWLFRIARNLIIDQIRREAKTVAPLDQEGQSGLELVPDTYSNRARCAGTGAARGVFDAQRSGALLQGNCPATGNNLEHRALAHALRIAKIAAAAAGGLR